MSQLLRAGRNA